MITSNKRNRSSYDEETDEYSREEKLASPIEKLSGSNDYYTFLGGNVKEQKTAMASIAERLQAIKEKRIAYYGQSNIFKFFFCGTSGCGKTETTRWIKFLFGMDPGYEHENQYLEVTRDLLDDDECDDDDEEIVESSDSLVNIEVLIRALNSLLSNYGTIKRKKGTRRYPRFVMLSIDELDKMPNKFFSRIQQLLNLGRLTTKTGASFVLPSETTLIVVFTSNYGEEGIRKMETKLDAEAIPLISKDMHNNGMSLSLVKNIENDIVPFYPLKTETLRGILAERLEQYIRESSISEQFGEISCADDVKNMLIDKVINLTEPGRGIRQGLGRLLEKIGTFFGKVLQELIKKENIMQSVYAKNSLVFTLQEIDLKKFDEAIEEECIEFIREIMQCLMNDPRSVASVEDHRKRNENINALSMYVGQNHLVSSELGHVAYTNQENNFFNNCNFSVSPVQVARLKEENQELKGALEKVDTLVKTSKDVSPFYREVKGIVSESKKILTRHYEEMGEEGYSSRSLLTLVGGSLSSNNVEEMMSSSGCDEEDDDDDEEEEEEEEPEVPVTNDVKVLSKYGNLTRKQLREISIDSDVDEDSEEDKKMIAEYQRKKDSILKKKLLKEEQKRMCIGSCRKVKSPKCFNPTLYKPKTGGTPSLHLRKVCTQCYNSARK